MHVLYMDFETTGLDPAAGAEPVEFAAMLLSPKLVELARFETGVMTLTSNAVVSEAAMNTHKIPMETILDGVPQKFALVDFTVWLQIEMEKIWAEHGDKERLMLAGHNVQFDIRFLKDWFARYEKMHLYDRYFHYRTIEAQTLVWARLGFPGILKSTSLQACTGWFKIEHSAHRAMGDVEAGVEVLRRLVLQISAPVQSR